MRQSEQEVRPQCSSDRVEAASFRYAAKLPDNAAMSLRTWWNVMLRTANTERRPSRPSITVAVIGTSQKSDRRIAREIRNAVGRRATVTEVDVDELASMGTNVRRSIYMNGPVPVFVISEAMLATASRRAVLASGNPYLDEPDYRAYFIWSLKNPAESIRNYPDLTLFADNMPMVRPRGDVIDDLKKDLPSHTKPTLGKLVRSFFRSLGSLLMVRLAWLLIMARLAGFVAQMATILLVILLLFDAGGKWRPALAVLSLINLGWIFGGIETLDVWPWFCGDADAESAARARRLIRFQTYLTQGSLLLFFTVPSLISMKRDAIPPLWMAGAAAIGFLYEIALTLTYRHYWPLHFARLGVSSETILNPRHLRLRVQIKGRRLPRPVLGIFNDEERPQVAMWIDAVTLGARAFARPWRRSNDDFVFISYAWADDRQKRTVGALSDVLARANVPHFLDRNAIRSDSVNWKPNVAAAVARATHVLLVVSPRLAEAQTVQREAATIVARWHIDTLPAVLCIGDEALGVDLMTDVSVPLNLRFMLAWCVWLTWEEAMDPALLASAVAFHRRNGRLADWAALFGF